MQLIEERKSKNNIINKEKEIKKEKKKDMDYIKVSSKNKIYQYPLIRLQGDPSIHHGSVSSIPCDSYMYRNLSDDLLSLDKFDILVLKFYEKEKEPRLLLGSYIGAECNLDLTLYKYTIDIILLEEIGNYMELAVDLDMSKITSTLNNAWREFNFKEASFFQNLIREKIPMSIESGDAFQFSNDDLLARTSPGTLERLGTGLKSIEENNLKYLE